MELIIYGVYTFLAAYNAGNMMSLQIQHYGIYHFVGKENFKEATNYIVVCNHNSLMDVPVSTPFMPRANKTIAKKEFTKVPVFGWVYAFGSVLVDRKSDASRKKVMMK